MKEPQKMGTISFGRSLPVPNVQALSASDNLKEIPQRYVRPEAEAEVVSNVDEEIPVIDISRLVDVQFTQEEATKLKFACEEWGFFQIINHGVPNEVIEGMQVDVQEFFKQPLEQKMTSSQLSDSTEGYGQAFVVSEEQKLDWADLLTFFTQPPQIRNIKLWPTCPPTFRTTLDSYSMEMKKVAIYLLGVISNNLGFEQEKLTDLFKEGMQGVRVNYYPPCPKANKVLGLTPHSDADGLTLLLQVNDVAGLQIKRNGQWHPINPLRDAFVVNIGDVLEIMSNGKYKSIEHRAVINTDKERISVATFLRPNMDAFIGPLQDLETSSEPYYKTMRSDDYLKMFLSLKLDGKNFLEHMKLKN